MKLYYCENELAEGNEWFYILDTGYGPVLEMHRDDQQIDYNSMEQFLECWKGIEDNLIMVEIR